MQLRYVETMTQTHSLPVSQQYLVVYLVVLHNQDLVKQVENVHLSSLCFVVILRDVAQQAQGSLAIDPEHAQACHIFPSL